MATSVDCDIVSAEESIFEGKVEFISLTGTLGELGIYPGHTPLLSEVKPGPVRLRMESGEEDIFYVSGGFLEVQPHKVILLADTALRAADLDEAAAEDAGPAGDSPGTAAEAAGHWRASFRGRWGYRHLAEFGDPAPSQ